MGRPLAWPRRSFERFPKEVDELAAWVDVAEHQQFGDRPEREGGQRAGDDLAVLLHSDLIHFTSRKPRGLWAWSSFVGFTGVMGVSPGVRILP